MHGFDVHNYTKTFTKITKEHELMQDQAKIDYMYMALTTFHASARITVVLWDIILYYIGALFWLSWLV